MATLTLALKILSPTKIKRQILDDAIGRYNKALQYLLCHTRPLCREIEQQMKEGRACSTRYIVSRLDKALLKELNAFGVQPFKDALKLDYAITLLTYLSLKKVQKHVRYPMVSLDEEDFQKEFVYLVEKESLDPRQISRLFDKYEAKTSLFFGRYSPVRDYCLLYNQASGRFYAKMYLMNVKDKNRRGNILRQNSQLQYLTKEGGYLEEDNRHERYLVVPLSFGKHQLQLLRQGMENPEMFKTARLQKRKNGYYLNVNIEVKAPKGKKATNFMGVTRSLHHSVHYTICDKKKNILDTGWLTADLQSKNSFHQLANQLADLAQKYSAHVIAYRLNSKGDHLWVEDAYPQMSTGQYNKLISMLGYKLELKGQEAPTVVSPRGVFYTCPKCGKNTSRNRLTPQVFLCVRCGHSSALEPNGSYNLATRLLTYQNKKIKFKVEKIGDRVRIYNDILHLSFEGKQDESCLKQFYCYLEEKIEQLRGEKIALEQIETGEQKKYLSHLKRFLEINDVRKEVQVEAD